MRNFYEIGGALTDAAFRHKYNFSTIEAANCLDYYRFVTWC